MDKTSLMELLNTTEFVTHESSSTSSEDFQEIEKSVADENVEESDELKEPEGIMTVTEVGIDVSKHQSLAKKFAQVSLYKLHN